MECSKGRLSGGRYETQRLALIALIVVASIGCETYTANGPTTIAASTAPTTDITVSDGALPCTPDYPWCGEFRASVGTPVHNAYVYLTPYHLGAWTRTWSPKGLTAQVEAVGTATIRRGEGNQLRQTSFPLNCATIGTECGKGIAYANTCSSERNEVIGTSRNSARPPDSFIATWLGFFKDDQWCDGPPHEDLACDENGMYVDDGGDPANCPPSDDGGGDSGSGTQYQTGDYTNGETVDWATGVGNGGTSVCGGAAQVDYVCIDIWDDSSGGWREWGCGYATTC